MSRIAARARQTETDRPNPFHTPKPEEPVDTFTEDLADEVLGPDGEVVGPSLPPGASEPSEARVLVASGSTAPQTISVVPLHGGSGTTTLCRVLERSTDPFIFDASSHMGVVPERGAAILVARTSGIGLERAHTAAREWGSGLHEGLALLGVVLVADGPRTDARLRAQAKRVARMYPRAWRVEWVPDWHLTARPELDRVPRRVLGMRKKIVRWAADRGLEATPKEKK